MKENTQWKDDILAALNTGPLTKSQFYDVIPGFFKNKCEYDEALKTLIADKRVESFIEAPYGKERTSFRLVVKEAGQDQDQQSTNDETIKGQAPPVGHDGTEFSFLNPENLRLGEILGCEKYECDAPDNCDLDLVVRDADSSDEQDPPAELFDDPPNAPKAKENKVPVASRSGWTTTILVMLVTLLLFILTAFAILPIHSTTGQETALEDLPIMKSAEPVLPELPYKLISPKPPTYPRQYVIMASSPFTIDLRALTTAPAATLRSLAEGFPEGNNTARLYHVELSILPSTDE